MSEAKPFASLSSGLLARKGGAKPAMRRPNVNADSGDIPENGQDDLGWNDMGYDVNPDISNEEPIEKPLFNPLAKAVEVPKPEVKQQQERIAAQLQASNIQEDDNIEKVEDSSTIVLHPTVNETPVVEELQDYQSPLVSKSVKSTTNEQVEIKPNEQVESIISKKAQPIRNIKSRAKNTSQKAGKAKSKAAFTLRLDPDRHLKLRLACAINNISAQKFVTDALDQRLAEMEEINQLSSQIAENK